MATLIYNDTKALANEKGLLFGVAYKLSKYSKKCLETVLKWFLKQKWA